MEQNKQVVGSLFAFVESGFEGNTVTHCIGGVCTRIYLTEQAAYLAHTVHIHPSRQEGKLTL